MLKEWTDSTVDEGCRVAGGKGREGGTLVVVRRVMTHPPLPAAIFPAGCSLVGCTLFLLLPSLFSCIFYQLFIFCVFKSLILISRVGVSWTRARDRRHLHLAYY